MVRLVVAAALAVGTSFAALPTAHAQGLVRCADEDDFCHVPYPTLVIYGARGHRTAIFVSGRGVPCSNEVFGDPAPGKDKRCAFVARGYGGLSDGGRRFYEEDEEDEED